MSKKDTKQKSMTTEEFTDSLSRRQYLQIELRRVMTMMEGEIANIKASYGQEIANLQLQIESETKAQFAWMKEYKRYFDGPPRSIEFTAAVVGYRLGQPHLKPLSKWTWAKVLEAIQRLNPAFVRNIPEVDREQLLAQQDDFGADGLATFGVKVVQDDNPYIDIKEEDPKQFSSSKVAGLLFALALPFLGGCYTPTEPEQQTFWMKQIAVSEQRQADAMERIADKIEATMSAIRNRPYEPVVVVPIQDAGKIPKE